MKQKTTMTKLLKCFFTGLILNFSLFAFANSSQSACSPESRYLDDCVGQRQYGNNVSYRGAFSQNTPNGTGVMTWADGVSFTGLFSDGRPSQNGVYKDRSGALLYGVDRRLVELIDIGKLEFNSGNGYDGEHRKGKPHGKGTYFYRNGTRFEGSFVDGVRTGQGVEYDRSGAVSRSGEWRLDELIRSDISFTQGRTKPEVEKGQREPAKLAPRLAIQASATKPDIDGNFVISIETGADTASLKIDDEEKGGNQSGKYSIRRVARVGQNNLLTITAKDIYGNTDTKTISVERQAADSRPTFSRLNPANIKPQPARDAVAIIIGIQNYKLIPKAEYANQDAQDFYDYASRALGIKQENIKLLLDDEADVSGIFKAFQNWLPLKVRKGKTDVYVFYSGHGLPGTDGKSLYFLPVGADKDIIAKTAISQKEIVDALKSAQPKSVTMFIDSCYSGQIRTGETLLASARPVVMKVDEIAYPPEFTVITASASDQIASSSPDLKHGIFSYYLMKGLEGEADENRDGTITIGKLQSYLSDRVPRFAMTMSRKQEPQLVGDSNRVLVGR